MTRWQWIGIHSLGAGLVGGVAGAIAGAAPIGLIAVGITGVVVSGVDIYHTYEIIKSEVGITPCTITRLLFDVVGMVFSGVGIAKGVQAWQASGSGLRWVGGSLPLSGKLALDEMYSQSRPGHGLNIREVSGNDALNWFNKIADPMSVRPHPNPIIASQGGLAGTIKGGGQIFYRPITSSGNPAIDTFNAAGYTINWKYHFPLK